MVMSFVGGTSKSFFREKFFLREFLAVRNAISVDMISKSTSVRINAPFAFRAVGYEEVRRGKKG